MKKIAGIFLTVLVFAQISVAQNLAKYNLSFPALADK
jgi:hypothetical protein